MASVQDCTVQVFQGVVCGLALQNMKQEESDRKGIELVRLSADCQAQYHELMELFENPDFCQAVSKRDIGLVGAGLMLIVTITRPITQKLRAELSDVSDPYRPALAAILDDIDASVERLEEILEAWTIALDEPELASEITSAAKEAQSGKKKEDIPNWRKIVGQIRR